MCFPTGNPSTWSSDGNANLNFRTSWEIEVFSMSLHGIFSRGIRATLLAGASSLIGASWVMLDTPWTEVFGEEVVESEAYPVRKKKCEMI